MALNQISQQHTSLTKVAIGWLLAVFALLSAQLALANAPPTIDSIAAGGPGQAVVTFTPGLANEFSPITGYRYINDDGTLIDYTLGYTSSQPTAIAIDAAGNVYTANASSNSVSKIAPDGTTSVFDITGRFPIRIAVDAAGNVYTANSRSNDVSKITPDGTSSILASTLYGTAADTADGKFGVHPVAIAVDAAGNVYTANYSSNTVSKITPAGDVTIFGETDVGPAAITLDAAGNVYTANQGFGPIGCRPRDCANVNNVSKIRPDGAAFILGTTGEVPNGIAVDAAGNVYTSNGLSSNMSKITPDGFSTTSETILTTGVSSAPQGIGSAPQGIAVDAAGNVYMPSWLDDNVTKITPDGTMTILAGTGHGPVAIAIDKAGNIYTANSTYGSVTKIIDSSIATYPATGDTSPITITGLYSGTEYVLSLIAVSGAGESVASNSVSFNNVAAIAPDAPTIDSIRPGAGQLTVAFTPGYDNGSPITSYTASCLRVVGSGRVRINVVGSTSPIAVTSMYNGDTYECFVTATNIFGTGPASATSEPFVVGTVTISEPGAPQITNIEPGDAQVSISVSVADDGWSPITGYNAYCSGDRFLFGASPTSPIAVSGLTNGVSYTCAVTATNDLGESPTSATSESFVVGAPDTFVPPPLYGTPRSSICFPLKIAPSCFSSSATSSATPVPTSPLWLLGIMAGLLSLVGFRKLRKA